MRRAPGIPAFSAICLGRLRFPSTPPPTKPLRTLVISKSPSRRSKIACAPCAMCARLSLRRLYDDVVLLEDRVGGVTREQDCVEQRRRVRAEVVRAKARPRRRDVAAEVRQAPRDGEAEPGRGRCEAPVDRPQRLLEPALRVEQGRLLPPDAQLRGHELVVERRDDHLDAVVRDHRHVDQEVLLRRQDGRRCVGARRRGDPVDELVQAAGREDCSGAPGQEVPARHILGHAGMVDGEGRPSRRPSPHARRSAAPSRRRTWCRRRPTSIRSSGR